jgi:hypothetical protein
MPEQPFLIVSAIHLGYDKSLSVFFRKQTWRGIGMLGTARGGEIDKPLVMTLLHGSLLCAGLLYLALSAVPGHFRILGLFALAFAAPALTVAYRYVQGGGGRSPVRETFLYFVYYAARLRALYLILVRGSSSRPSNPVSSEARRRAGAAELTPRK